MSLHGRASREQPGSRWVPPFGNKKGNILAASCDQSGRRDRSRTDGVNGRGRSGGRLLLRFERLSGADGLPFGFRRDRGIACCMIGLFPYR
jgi:hypothetical protein